MSLIPKPGDLAALRFAGLDSRGARVTVLGILAVVLLAVGVWLVVTGTIAVGSARAILDDGHRVTATVSSTQTVVPNPVGAPDTTIEITTVRFTTDDGVAIETDLPQAGAQPDLAPGDSVEIVYGDADPSAVLVDGDGILASIVVGIWAGAILALGGLALALVAVRVFRKGPDTPA